MARAVQDGKYMDHNVPMRVPKMPRLEGRALKLYKKHFGQTRYQDYNTRRTYKLGKREELPAVCVHQPRHDVESYFCGRPFQMWMLRPRMTL